MPLQYSPTRTTLLGLSLKQIDQAFSSTYKRAGQAVKTWGELGATGGWTSKPVSLYGRNSASGTYGFFKKRLHF